jgi:cyclohexanecarboxylate-CoA ligase
MPLRPTALRQEDAARYRRQGHWSPAPVAQRFADTCAREPYKVALVDGERRLTFAELDRLSRRLALGLLSLGVSPGDPIAYPLPNWWETVVIFLAAARIGAVANPILPIFRERELAFILRQTGASVIFVPGVFRGCDYRALLATIRRELPDRAQILVVRDDPPAAMRSFAQFLETPWERAPQTADRVVTSVDPASVLLLMYTSGTTAEPKGVLHTHQTLIAEVDSLARVHRLTAADTTLMPSPLTHVSGLIHAILAPALLGTTAVLMERWEPGEALRLMERERVSYMVGAPAFLQDLTADTHRASHDLTSFRLFSCGGANVSADLIRHARRRLGCVAKRVYGSTEFPTITTTGAADAETMGIETEGRAIPPAEVRIAGEDGSALLPGSEGEVQARGPECFVGYSDPTLNAEAFTPDGWFRTGDLGSLDAAGYLRITGRSKDIVIRKGEKFSVREVEDLIARHAAVAEAVVVAVPDANTGERACAVVELRPDHSLTLEQLASFLTQQGLARQKLPEQLVVRATLPRTESGKIHRAAVKAELLGSGKN